MLATIDPHSPEPRFVIEVHDTGIGIPAERIDGIFIPFEQADSSITRRFGGTGLGLAICRCIAAGLGGQITVESKPGQGSVFRVTLNTGPLDDVRICESPPSESVSPAATAHLYSSTALALSRILLVEDGEINRQLIRVILQDAGAEVVCVENGQQALESVDREQFDLILMDMQMPVMDGYTATQRLRDRGCMLPIIALTAHAMRGDREKCFAAGCSRYLSKPINIDKLLHTVADTLGVAEFGDSDSETSLLQAAEQVSTQSLSAITSTLTAENPQFRLIVQMFVEKLQGKLAEMQAAHGDADLDKLAELAHWLKGTGGTVGFDCLTEPATQLELSARRQRLDEVAECLQRLVTLSDRIAVPTLVPPGRSSID